MFLTSFERGLIKNDASKFLASLETCEIHLDYQVPVNPVEDDVYDVVIATGWLEKKICCKASQQIIRPYHNQILDWGIVKSGDCLFYVDDDIDLSTIDYKTCVISVKTKPQSSAIQWILVPRDPGRYQDQLGFRLGNDIVFQALACTLNQSQS